MERKAGGRLSAGNHHSTAWGSGQVPRSPTFQTSLTACRPRTGPLVGGRWFRQPANLDDLLRACERPPCPHCMGRSVDVVFTLREFMAASRNMQGL